MSKYTAIAKLNFEVPDNYIEYSYMLGTIIKVRKFNVLWQISISRNEIIYGVCKDNLMRVLTPAGLDFVQEKYVESKL